MIPGITSSLRIDHGGPSNTIPAAITGVGYDGQTLTATAGTWVGGTPTGQWYADAVAISGATSLTYLVPYAYDGAAFLYRETVGAVTQDSNTIHNWTPDDITTLLWLDAADASTLTLTGSDVDQWDDKSGNGRDLASTGSSAAYSSSNSIANDRPAVTPVSGSVYTAITAFESTDMIMCCAYKAGTESTFSSYHCFASLTKPAHGHAGQNYMYATNSLDSTPSVNGAGTSNVVLPLPLSTVHFSYTARTEDTKPFWQSGFSRGFTGPITQFIMLGSSNTTAEIEKVEAYMAYRDGFTLDSGHTYYSAAPTV